MERHMSNNCITPKGFTPVRRKENTVNQGRIQGDKEQEWTTARCHRLLRALTSRIAILNKEISRYSSAQQPGDESRSKTQNLPRKKPEDGDWMHPRKKVKQTYSARGTGRRNGEQLACRGRVSQLHDERRSLVPGEVAVSTPVLARARGEMWPPRPEDSSQTGEIDFLDNGRRRRLTSRCLAGSRGSSWQLSRTLREMKQNVEPTRYSTYEGIYAGLEGLIRSTTKEEPEKSPRGAKSLFSMALKAIPRYISEQEQLLSAHVQETGSKCAITSRDISTEVYDELELLGSSGKSWRHLRTVVRSHGIQVVVDAIQAGLFDVDFCGVLITLLVELSAIEEAESLLSALLHSSSFPKPKTIYDPLDRRLLMLVKYVEHTGRIWFQYNQLSKLIVDGELSTFWLATKGFGPFWAASVQSISSGTFGANSLFAFLDASLPSLAAAATLNESEHRTMTATENSFSTASENTFASLLTIISSIFMLNKETRIFGTRQSLGYEAIVPLLRSCSLGLKILVKYTNAQQVLLLMVQALIESKVESDIGLSEVAGSLQEELVRYENFLDILTTHDNLASLVSNIARCCGRGASTSGFEYLQKMHSTLETLGCGIAGGDILNAVVVDSAYLFADKNSDRQHLDYASCIEKRFASRIVPSKKCQGAGGSNEITTGFRWEEGISEWVTVTPTARILKRKMPVPSRREEESECDTPFRPAIRRQREGVRCPIMPSAPGDSSPMVETSSSPDETRFRNLSEEAESSNQSSEYHSDDELIADHSSEDESVSETSESSTGDCFVPSETGKLLGGRRSHPRATVLKPPRVDQQIPRNSQDQRVKTTRTTRTADSTSREGSQAGRFIDHAPELGGRRALRLSQNWQVFDESDDELSFISASSASSAQVLREVTNDRLRSSRGRAQAKQKKNKRRAVQMSLSDESEDELCI